MSENALDGGSLAAWPHAGQPGNHGHQEGHGAASYGERALGRSESSSASKQQDTTSRSSIVLPCHSTVLI